MSQLGRGMRSRGVWALLLVWLFSFPAGCSGTRREVISPLTSAREEFDPITLDDDDFLLQPTTPSGKAPLPGRTPPLSLSREMASGYRVQIAAVLDGVRAEGVRKEAERKFKTSAYTNYDEDTLLYKIHLGDCRNAPDAKKIREQAKNGGFPEAFIVRAQIEVAARSPVVRRPETALGFRVQIFSAKSQLAAEGVQTEAREQLGRDDVYLVLEAPYFKVRVGNLRTRKEAEALVKKVKEKGYDAAFSARTQILVSPE